ncbi:C-type lectin 37Da-like [Drosophila subpulchrella]|uniref:C-type lectin 37Da-like n=1 Tax=Drosophila subpulchrella TaxID=1486046 RepID=UPI0018A1A43A|nr:C-type lectin 37Da-like [Drosophila subpulchrella]
MLKKFVAIFLAFASIDLGLSFDKYSTEILNGNPHNLAINSSPFIKIHEGYYYFGQDSVNWYVAYENCRKLGSELVAFESNQEFDAVIGYIGRNLERRKFWTSGNDLGKTGTHKWFSNAQHINLNRWASGQPDNYKGVEHCIQFGYIYVNSKEYQLDDNPCSASKNYVCEAPEQETISIVVWK